MKLIDFGKIASRLKNDQKGVALIFSLILMVLLLLLTMSAFEMVTVNAQIADNHIRDLQALYIADAGIDDEVYQIRTGTPGNLPNVACGPGHYAVTVDEDANIIESTGTIYNSTRKIRAEYEVVEGNSLPTVLIKTWTEVLD